MNLLNPIYQLLWRIAPPIIRYYLRRRAQKNPAYLDHWDERFGKPHPNPVQNAIWVHAVSVGETRAAEPIIAALRQYLPDAPLLITQMTPTGRATAQAIFPDAQCRYLPYDRTDWVAQFLYEHRPICGIIMETEIWVNLFTAAKQANVPLFLANARLSEKSQRGYLKAVDLFRPALVQLTGCFAQTAADATRLQALGVANVQVYGNSKYDIAPTNQSFELYKQFREKIGQRRVFVAASLREKNGVDEVDLILDAWAKWGNHADLLVLIPRHPERFEYAYYAAQKRGFNVQKRIDNQVINPKTAVWIGDSMGELFAYYLMADVVFVGGSLVETGCQNIIEPISCHKPVLFGQSIYNFQAACETAAAQGAAKQVLDADDLMQTAADLLTQPQNTHKMAQRGKEWLRQHQGASARMAQAIAAEIS